MMLNDIELDSFRKLIGYVPQDVFFSDTIYNNIAFGLNENGDVDQDVETCS